MDTVTLHPGTPAESRWTVTDRRHTHCAECREAAHTAAVYASAIGSRGGTYRPEYRDLHGAVTASHSATVTIARS